MEDKDNLNEELKEKYLTILKMLLYLYVNIDNFLLTLIEDNNAMAQNKVIIVSNSGTRNVAKQFLNSCMKLKIGGTSSTRVHHLIF